jgi:hypothetical protein
VGWVPLRKLDTQSCGYRSNFRPRPNHLFPEFRRIVIQLANEQGLNAAVGEETGHIFRCGRSDGLVEEGVAPTCGRLNNGTRRCVEQQSALYCGSLNAKNAARNVAGRIATVSRRGAVLIAAHRANDFR